MSQSDSLHEPSMYSSVCYCSSCEAQRMNNYFKSRKNNDTVAIAKDPADDGPEVEILRKSR